MDEVQEEQEDEGAGSSEKRIKIENEKRKRWVVYQTNYFCTVHDGWMLPC